MPISPLVIEIIQLKLSNPDKHQGYISAVRYVHRTISRDGAQATPLIYNYSGLKQAVETVKWVRSCTS